MSDETGLMSGAGVACTIAPLVVLAALDHYMRRPEGQVRVIGTLLGANNDGSLEITNCFPVPHSEAEGVDADTMDYHRSMYQLFRQSNPTEIILGWYTTGDAINEASIVIHDFYGREIQRPPVHLCVGTDLRKGVTLAAYMGASVALKDRVFGSHFSRVPLQLSIEGTDRAVLQAGLNKGTASPKQLQATLGVLAGHLEALLAACRDVSKRDARVGRALLGALGKRPQKMVEEAYEGALQDVLSIATLGKLTRAQIQLCAALHAMFTPAAAATAGGAGAAAAAAASDGHA